MNPSLDPPASIKFTDPLNTEPLLDGLEDIAAESGSHDPLYFVLLFGRARRRSEEVPDRLSAN